MWTLPVRFLDMTLKTPVLPGVFSFFPVEKPVDNVENSLSQNFPFVVF